MPRSIFVLIALGSAFGCSAADGPSSVPMQLLNNLPVVTAKIDGYDVPLVFDLGDAKRFSARKLPVAGGSKGSKAD